MQAARAGFCRVPPSPLLGDQVAGPCFNNWFCAQLCNLCCSGTMSYCSGWSKFTFLGPNCAQRLFFSMGHGQFWGHQLPPAWAHAGCSTDSSHGHPPRVLPLGTAAPGASLPSSKLLPMFPRCRCPQSSSLGGAALPAQKSTGLQITFMSGERKKKLKKLN